MTATLSCGRTVCRVTFSFIGVDTATLFFESTSYVFAAVNTHQSIRSVFFLSCKQFVRKSSPIVFERRKEE